MSFSFKQASRDRSAPPYVQGLRAKADTQEEHGVGAHPTRKGLRPPPFLHFSTAFLSSTPLFSGLLVTQSRPSGKATRSKMEHGRQRRGTGSATTSSEAGTLGVKARNAPGAPRGSQKQGACTCPDGKGVQRYGPATLPGSG